MTGWTIATAILGVTTLALVYVLIGMLRFRSAMFGPVYYRGDVNRRRVALTFDDGPNHRSTDRVLDILARENVRATFFVIGLNASVAPELLKRMDAEGHQIANHTYDHHHVGFLRGPFYWQKQIAATNAIIEDAIGKCPAMFRPPMGIKSPFIAWTTRRFSQAVMLWTIRTRDGTTQPADLLVAPVAERAGPGDVIVMHDGMDPHRWRDPAGMLEALPRIIALLRQSNLEPVRLDELFELPAYVENRASKSRDTGCQPVQ